jgi:hypothetical protein
MERYVMHRERFDRWVQAYLKANATQPPSPRSTNTHMGRTLFTQKEDKQLLVFLAKLSLTEQGAKYGRSGRAIYKDVLVAQVSLARSPLVMQVWSSFVIVARQVSMG